MAKERKGPKVLDPGNVCKCGKSGDALHKCPYDVISVLENPGFKPTPCNCCGACQSKCYMAV